jgi:MFS family permease
MDNSTPVADSPPVTIPGTVTTEPPSLTTTPVPAPSAAPAAAPAKTSMGRVAVATTIGTTIEYYDFFIYGTAAALVFPALFFPALGAVAGTVASFATFAVAFFARPVGAVIFGHFGDRIGRKRALISTLLIMGVSTVLIGLLPTPAVLGELAVLAPILLVTLRFLQGFAVGGEWAGAALMAAEYAPPKQRGFFSSLPMLGPALAFGLASATFLVTNITLGDSSEAFTEIGWRVPFILSGALVAIGLWIRVSIEETPVFRAEQEAAAARLEGGAPVSRPMPFLDSFRFQWKEMLFGGLAFSSLFAFFYIGTSFLTNYGSAAMGLPRNEVLLAGLVSSVFFAAAIVLAGVASDRFGRKRTVLYAGVAAVLWAPVMFSMLDAGAAAGRGMLVFTVAVSVTLMIVGFMLGPAGSFLPELFETRYRYTGAGMAYSMAGVFGGAIPPLAAVSLSGTFGGWSVGLMLAVIAVVSLLTLLALRETRGNDLGQSVSR